ncbi:MAG: GAF domain-containing SpoIIE family protein phosphatase [Akkermansiaceae bacterium]|nr:GAF domain-containing SpoIIE family protein phosphatase [Akkermansiaceae bacterium]
MATLEISAELQYLTWALGGFMALTIAVMIFAIRNQRRRNHRMRTRFRDFEGEEQRMFCFLHELGTAIEVEPSHSALSRIIVDGISDVVNAHGGAIYFLNDEGDSLVPAYLSAKCPPLVGIPYEVRKKSTRDSRALESHIRLSRVAIDEGILGYCLSVGAPIHVKDVKSHPSFSDSLVNYNYDVTVMAAPLKYAGKDLGVLAVARMHEQGPFMPNDFAVFGSAAEQSAFAIGNAQVHREAQEKRRMDTELRNAREVQRVLLPREEPVIPGFRVCGVNVPARVISGDYYDYLELGDHKHGIAIADVSGKGVPAGLLMAMCRSALRSVAPGLSSPAAILSAVNRQLFPDIREDMFISMAFYIVDERSGRVTLARAGHDPALWYRQEGQRVEQLRSPGMALGVDGGEVFERVIQDQEIQLEPGDCLLLHTDGVREALNDQEQEFGMERMSSCFRESAMLGAQVVLDRMQEELGQFAGEGRQMDDITLVAIEKKR